MTRLYLTTQDELPPPIRSIDLAIWAAPATLSEAHVRSWAGWSECHVLAGSRDSWCGYRPNLDQWPAAPLAFGYGYIWRFGRHYLALVDHATLMVPEVPRAMALAGVVLIISQSEEGRSPFIHPLWRAVQANQIFGLRIGRVPSWYLPCEIDPDEQGIGLMAVEAGGWVIDFDVERLMEARRRFPIQQGLRPTLYKAQAWWPHE
jgi:hypothetical protein